MEPTARPWVAHYDAGVPALIEIPARPVDDLLRQAAADRPERVALDFLGAHTSYRRLDEQVDRFARALGGMGVRPGDRVSLHLPTSPAFVIAAQGAFRAGAIAVPVNPLYVEREVAQLLHQTGPLVSVALDLLVPRVRAVRREVDGTDPAGRLVAVGIQDMLPAPLKWLYPLRARREGRWHPVPDSAAVPNLYRLLARTPGGRVESAAASDDPAVLQATGGTTGIPKCAVLTHRNLVANAMQVAAWYPVEPEGEDRILCALPYFHSYGLTVAMDFALLRGATQVLLPRFDPGQVLRVIARKRPRLFPGAPVMYAALAEHPERAKFDLSSVEACISGAAPLPGEVQARFEAATGGRLVEGYGLTEASPVTHCNPVLGERRAGTVGLPFPSTEARVMELESRMREVPPGEVGELAVRGPQVMSGYWQQPEETAQVLREGWLFTGDLARQDADGYFSIVDRLKDLILVGGMNVYPREIEEVLLTHPAVAEAAVVGVPDARHGEVPRAYVALRPGAAATPEELLEFCRERLARFKVPRSLEIRDELPRTFVGKVLRRELAAEYEASRARPEA